MNVMNLKPVNPEVDRLKKMMQLGCIGLVNAAAAVYKLLYDDKLTYEEANEAIRMLAKVKVK